MNLKNLQDRISGQEDPDAPTASKPGLPFGVWALGNVSLFMDISSELIHSLLPVFMSSVLGAGMITIGFVEGIAEGTASMTKVFSGFLSDHIRKRKSLLIFGYGLSAITKPIFPLANTIGWVFTGRFVDRVGKGVRGAPRDALIADITAPSMRGAAYGLRQALDSVGAFAGPALAVAFMFWFANDIRSVLWVGTVPALIAVGWLIIGVHEPDRLQSDVRRPGTFSFAGIQRLTPRYWLVVLLGAVFTLARFSEAFLVLRAQSVGIALGYVPLVMIVMNVVYSAMAYPAGRAADRYTARKLLVAGLIVLFVADLVLATAGNAWQVFAGALLWGLHMALTQGLLAKLVSDAAPPDLRGSAFGIFNLVSGGVLFVASIVAGTLWDLIGPFATFTAGAVFSAMAAAGILLFRPAPRPAEGGQNGSP